MVDLAVQAFSTNNFKLAAEIYERQIAEHGPNSELYLGLANSYAKSGSLRKAFEAYLKASMLGKLTPRKLKHLVAALVDSIKGQENTDEMLDSFSCGSCQSLWFEPVTVNCGHTYCRRCIHKQYNNKCKICAAVISSSSKSAHNNVLLSKLSDKWFPEELKAARHKHLGNQLFEREDYEGALHEYTIAFQHAPNEHTLLSNRSFTFSQLLRYSEALVDADRCISLKPNWPKGHYRRGMALAGLGKHEDAAYAYLKCLGLDPSIQSAKEAMSKCLLKVISPFDFDDIKVSSAQHPVLAQVLQHRFGVSSSLTDLQQKSEQLQAATSEHLQAAASEHLQANTDAEGASSTRAGVESNTIKRSNSLPNFAGEKKSLSKTQSAQNLFQKANADACHRKIDPKLLNKEDVDCSLCFRVLFRPVTTYCGHTFCLSCLSRCLDHKPQCPLCKQLLEENYLIDQLRVSESVERILQLYFTEDYDKRQKIHQEELGSLYSCGTSSRAVVPIFVCVLALPLLPCPLHIFEPKYRLMIRQCMESGTRQFGMCLATPEGSHVDVGTMLEINRVEMLPDGRSKVDTTGGRRFHVIEKSQRDGYNTALVEFIQDKPLEQAGLQALEHLHGSVMADSKAWFESLNPNQKAFITLHHGPFPLAEHDALTRPGGPQWHWWMVGTLPLCDQTKLDILPMNTLTERLTAIHKILVYIRQA